MATQRFITTVSIDKNEVCRRLGYKNHAPQKFVLSLIDKQIERAYTLIKPVCTYELKEIEFIEGGRVFVANSLVFTSKILSYALSDCEKVAIFLATIGHEFDNEISRLVQEGGILDATILDAIGSEAVEKIACHLGSAIEIVAEAKGCQATLRYSPGYCDWDISEQRVIFKGVDWRGTGVELTESCLMIPEKSVSGIIGIGKLDQNKPKPCLSVCKMNASCMYKRI